MYLNILSSCCLISLKSVSIESIPYFNAPIAGTFKLPTSYLDIPVSGKSRFKESSPFPPNITGFNFLSRSNILLFVTKPPTPKSPYSDLCPANISISISVSLRFILIFPAACAASANTTATYSFAMCAIFSNGSIYPVTLLAIFIHTKSGSSHIN